MNPKGPHDGLIGILYTHTCTELPCTGNFRTEDLSYIEYCPIQVLP